MKENQLDELQEKVRHGDYMLPFVQYVSWIPENFSSFSMHWHREVEIIYVECGCCEIQIDLQKYVIRKGDIIIIQPSALHALKQYGEENGCLLSWVFDVKMLSYGSTDACYIKYLGPFQEGKFEYPQIIDETCTVYSQLRDILLQLHQVCDGKGAVMEFNIKWRLERFFYILFRNVMQRKEQQTKQKQEALEHIRMVLDYIHENYQQNLTVGDLAGLLHFSEPYFMHFFKKYTETTCIDYINEYRLERAAELLRDTETTVMEIAMQVGIHNISYFNRMFKKKMNVTPREYRKYTREAGREIGMNKSLSTYND